MSTFERYKSFIALTSAVFSRFPLKFRQRLLVAFREKKGNIGVGIRYVLIKSTAKKCGDNVVVLENVYLKHVENMSFGDNVSINPMSYLDASVSGGIDIGNSVSIAHGVTIMASSHNYIDKGIYIKKQGGSDSLTVIHDDVWIGAKATIIAGAIVGRGCVVGANSVVTHDLSEYSVYAGCPARKIKERL